MTFKLAGGIKEQSVVVGNFYDKYGSRNPIVRHLMNGFKDSLDAFVQRSSPKDIHEVGCGEGYWVLRWKDRGFDARGSDFSASVIELAKANALRSGQGTDIFLTKSIYDLDAGDSADLVVCCEVMEHLEEPERAMAALKRVVRRDLIVSVPREPIWRMLNMARGKYLLSGGDTPGHIQHWSASGIRQLLSAHFEVLDVRTPLPWTMIYCRAKK